MRPGHILLVLMLAMVACGSPGTGATTAPTTSVPGSTVPDGDLLDELGVARDRWEDAGLDTYRFEFEDDCGECDPVSRLPRRVVVWHGEPAITRQPTVDQLFSTVELAIEEGRSVDISYHPELGHPTEIAIDMQARAYDGGTHWLVRDLEPGLPGEDPSLASLEAARVKWESSRPQAYEFRTDIGCDCPLAGAIWTEVHDDDVVDWNVDFADGERGSISPITVDEMFEDLAELFSSADGVVEGGIRFTGSSAYHPDLGYPVWVGLDIEVLDPDSELAGLPSRLVFSIYDFAPLETPSEEDTSDPDIRAARQGWAEAGLNDYTYRLTIHDIVTADFSDPYLVTVEDGVVVSIEHQGRPVDDTEIPMLAIDDLFDHIEAWQATGGTVEALYHDQLGYPVFVSFHGTDLMDVELVLSIHDLVSASEG